MLFCKLLLALVPLVCLGPAAVHLRDAASAHYPVDPLIGTGGDGFGVGSTPPGAQLPFAMMRLSPDTAFDNVALEWRHFGGYYYGDNEVRCFSHTHMVGAGVEDYGHIGVMATREVSPKIVRGYGCRSKFSHKNEIAYPGYYAVLLETPNVFTELTVAGLYTGVHRYTFIGPGSQFVLIDPTHSVQKDAVVNASLSFSGDNSTMLLSGWSLLKGSLTGRNGVGVKVYFAMRFPRPPLAHGTWDGGELNWHSRDAAGNSCGAFVEFPAEGGPVIVIVAISFISENQALANLVHDWQGQTFSECAERAQDTWTSALSQVEVESAANQAMLTKFYTSLYHALCAPTQFSEAGGWYLGMDNLEHQVANGSSGYFSDLSLWDIHRTQAPLLALLRPHSYSSDLSQDVSHGIVNSLVAMYKEGGALPRWPIANVYGGAMIGNHGYQIVLDNYVKGLRDFDVTAAYEGMREEATNPSLHHTARACLKEYVSMGYCPMEAAGNSVSLTLAYAFDDWAVGTLASLLNKSSDAALFLNRSKNYRNVWSSEKQLMCPRSSSGQFHCPLDPTFHEWMFKDSGYTEANAAEWRWFVPHDIPGLVSLFSTEQSFVQALGEFFDKAKDHRSNFLPNPYYWAGNEPDLLAVYLFNFAGRPDLTQKNVRWLLDNKYTTDPDGLPGNDDYGTMSAWFVWGALGLYPLTGTTTYFIGSPAVEKATLHLPSGQSLVITAVNLTAGNVYVEKASLNNRDIDMTRPFLQHTDITSGGHLAFWMTDQPTQYPTHRQPV